MIALGGVIVQAVEQTTEELKYLSPWRSLAAMGVGDWAAMLHLREPTAKAAGMVVPRGKDSF